MTMTSTMPSCSTTRSRSKSMTVRTRGSWQVAFVLRVVATNNIFKFRIATRIKAIDNIQIILKKFCMAESIDKWKLSLCEMVEKNLKRTSDEAVRSCAIAALLSIQMGKRLLRSLVNLAEVFF